MRGIFRRRWLRILLGLFLLALAILVPLWRSAIAKNRGAPDEPFRIAGNLYYVGNAGITAFLITGPEGHVLIDGGYPESAAAIMGSIAKLGFSISDVRVLLNTHAHSDHAGGLAALQQASGAELHVSEGDAPIIEAGGADDPTIVPQKYLPFIGRYPAPRIDRRLRDGDTVQVGPIVLTAHVTAGHTPGCTSWSFPVRDGDRELLAVNICSLSLLPFFSFVEPETYPGIRADFERSFATLRDLPADIFLGSHGSFFQMHRKRAAQAAAIAAGTDPATPFIDRAGYLEFVDRAEARFRTALSEQQ